MADLRRVGGTTDVLGEGPVWCPHEQALYWVDIPAPAVKRWRAATGENTIWPMPEAVGSLALCGDGKILLALKSALSLFDPATGAMTPLATPRDDGADMRFNDGKCDRQGRFWVGTMSGGARAPRGRLYRLDTNGCEAVLDGIDIPNGLCWSPDGRSMYFTDSVERTIWVFPYDPATGTIGERRVFARADPSEVPDGATIDAEGFMWSARFGGGRVVRHAPDGRVDRVLEIPARQVTSCAFGGPDFETLFITSATHNLTPEQRAAQPLAGTILATEVGVRGLPEPRYAL